MLYRTITIKEKEYKARLNARACVELERKLKTNPVNIFIKAGDGVLPSLQELLTILHASFEQYQHGISLDDIYDIYDAYCEDGGNMMSLITVLLDVFKDAGFVPKDKEGNDSKN